MEETASTKNGMKKGNGSLVAIIVVIILLLIGAFYIWQSRESSPSIQEPNENMADTGSTEEIEIAQAEITEEDLSRQGDSDELDSIESDLAATSFEGL
jgi:flagellar basal body-associated protein FliL